MVRPSIRSRADTFWNQWSQEYFVSHSSDELGWHLETLIDVDNDETVIALAANQTLTDIGSTQVLVSTPNRVHLFADLTACFSDLGLSVLDAKLHTSDAGRSIDVFIVQHDATCQPVTASDDQERLLRSLEKAAVGQYTENAGTRRTPRAHKYFNLPANVSIRPDLEGKRTLIELVAPDRAGLLTTVGRVFAEFGLDLSTAKIATLGERVEDVFYVTDSRGNNLYDDDFIQRLKEHLEHELNALSGALSDAESDLQRLKPYPFEQLAALFADAKTSNDLKPIPLSIGEPQHAPPQFVLDALIEHMGLIAKYPTTKGTDTLRQSIATWLNRRFSLETGPVSPDINVIPVNGTREAIFAAVQAAVDRHVGGKVVIPNPFYQIYEGAAFMAGLSPYYLPIMESGQPDYHAVLMQSGRTANSASFAPQVTQQGL